jgi:hypothetical protein
MIKAAKRKSSRAGDTTTLSYSAQSLFHHSAPMGEDPCLSVEGEILGPGVLSSEMVRL